MMKTPVYTLSGFLGAGKTTFVNGLLSQLPENVNIAIIVNEFGEIGIDGRILQKKDYLLKEITEGCICCTLKAKLADALLAIADDNVPDLILIETTGVARPKQVVSEFQLKRLSERVFSEQIITFLDAAVYARVGHKMPIINFQIEDADIIVLNKIDLVEEKTLHQLQSRLKSFTGDRKTIYETSFGKLPYDRLFPELAAGVPSKNYFHFGDISHNSAFDLNDLPQHVQGLHHGSHDSTEGFSSISIKLNTHITHEALNDFFGRYGEKIIRAKGLLKTEKGNRVLHFSSSGLQMEDYGKVLDKGELVIIVTDPERDSIEASLPEAFLDRT